jgi:iron complex outermembrane recepter protein
VVDFKHGRLALRCMRNRFTCLLIFLVFSSFSFLVQAQETPVQLKLLNEQHEPVSFVTVTVTDASDSLQKNLKLTDGSGSVVFQLQQRRHYTIHCAPAGFQPLEKNITVQGAAPVFTFTLTAVSKTMKGIVVTATKPLMRQEDDKTIVDPENLAAMSTNAFEILEKIPGLFVDQDGNIYLNSTTPARVYINGREQKMSAADMATLLKNLPPTAIASIEILRTPSARYDASGSGGIVNVIMKKGVRIGLTGSVTAGMTQGKYGNQFTGLNVNNNDGRLTTYLNLQYGRRSSYEHLETDRFFAIDSVLSQDALTKYWGDNYYLGYGIGYEPGKKWEVNYDGRFSYNHNNNRSTNFSRVSQISTGNLSGSGETAIRNRGDNRNLTQGLNAKYKIDSVGSEWTMDLSYTWSPGTTRPDFGYGDGVLENRLQFFSAQSNFVKKLPRKLTLEAGAKTTEVWFRNETGYYKFSGGNRLADPLRSGAYRYKEQIHSGYIQAARDFSGIIVKLGTRMENTNMAGDQILPSDTSFSIHRTDFFPYIYLSRDLMKIAGYPLRAYLVFRRTINRPVYEYLNPSQRFVDPYLYETGNPSLRPQFTKNYEANISVDERPIFAIGLNETRDIFTQVVYPSDTSRKVSLRTYDNLGSNRETYLRVLGALPPGGRYFFVMGIQYNRNHYRGLYESQPFSFRKGSWMVFTFHSFKLTPLTQLSMHGYARFNGQQQFYELRSFGELRFSVNRQFLKKKLNVAASVNDIFRTNRNEFVMNQGSVHAAGLRTTDSRRFGLNIRYNFGIRKKEETNPFNVDAPN